MSVATVTPLSPKPIPADVQPGGIPAEMKARAQWVCWAYELDGKGKWTKVPRHVSGRYKASVTDPSTWTTFDNAYAAYLDSTYEFAGIGYMFSGDEDDFAGVDLDHVRNPETGTIEAWRVDQRKCARWTDDAPEPLDIISTLATYAEISPSLTGVKLVVKGHLKQGGKAGDFEAYSKERYFAVTGLRMKDSPVTVNTVNGELDDIAGKFLRIVKRDEVDGADVDDGDDEPDDHTPEQDAALIEASCANDEKFSRLWAGNIEGYPSQSEADQALCNLLAFRCDGSRARVDRLFRQSKLMRPKWDTRRGSSTYGRDTVRKAVKSCKANDKKRTAAICNFEFVAKGKGDDGKTKYVAVPMMMDKCIERTQEITGNAIMRVDGGLFVDDKMAKPGAAEVDWLPKPASLFGFLASRARVDWKNGQGHIGREEFHAELCRTAPRFAAVEVLPHEPRLPGHYYACAEVESGDGTYLGLLLDQFAPAEPIDRDLIMAAFMTPFWGGPGGARPLIVITSDDGRGVGKSKLAEYIGQLSGGTIDFSANEDFAGLKTRLLSPDALTRRVPTLDNLKSLRLSWAEFEGVVTQPTISGRRLYVGEASRPNVLTWVLTMNGASFSCDMAQRSVPIKLKRPQRSATWQEDTTRLVVEHHREIVADIIGRLRQEPFRFAKFSRWASWERDVLSRVDDPAEAQQVIAERQGQFDVEEEEAGIIEDFFAEQLKRLDYRPDADTVFVPADVAARWFNWATGEKKAAVAVSRTLNQMANEGKLKRITKSDGRAHGRGFVWIGGTCRTGMAVDLLQRLATKSQEKRVSEDAF